MARPEHVCERAQLHQAARRLDKGANQPRHIVLPEPHWRERAPRQAHEALRERARIRTLAMHVTDSLEQRAQLAAHRPRDPRLQQPCQRRRVERQAGGLAPPPISVMLVGAAASSRPAHGLGRAQRRQRAMPVARCCGRVVCAAPWEARRHGMPTRPRGGPRAWLARAHAFAAETVRLVVLRRGEQHGPRGRGKRAPLAGSDHYYYDGGHGTRRGPT